MKFKIGDRVRRKAGSGYWDDFFKENQTGTITRIYTDSTNSIIANVLVDGVNINSFGNDTNNLELITDLDKSSEELIEILNKGQEALGILYEQKEEIEFKTKLGDGWYKSLDGKKGIIYRIKPKAKFDSRTTSNGWLISYQEDIIHIGCKSFDKKMLYEVLTSLIDENAGRYIRDSFDFKASSKGIVYGDNILSWADAELLFKQLKALK